jgi:4-coumarate--CoA ligase (photoactive yellow protein activation family)
MKSAMELTAPDLRALLASLARTSRLHASKAHYLFANGQGMDAVISSRSSQTDMDQKELRNVTRAFAEMLCMPDHAVDQLMGCLSMKEWDQCALGFWRLSPADLVFKTSGSTGIPNACKQSFALLEQEIQAQAEIFKEHKRIVTLVPRHHIYGFLFSILLPKALGVPVLELPLVPSRSQMEQLRPGDLVVAFPMFWKSLCALTPSFPPGVCGVTSTGPCPADVIHALLKLGLARITEVYGSSETGGIGTRHHPDHAYTLLPFWEPVSLGPDQAPSLARRLPDGRTTEPFKLPDLIQWETVRTFRPLKREDKCVQVAGVNVYPEKVADCIQSHPSVRSCAVRLMRPEEGQRLKAFVVLRDESQLDGFRRDIRPWLAQRLSASEIPKSLTYGTVLPKNAMGKDADWD